jgi:DNA-binding XRE family transcriptional regulator
MRNVIIDFGARVKELRERLHLTQEAMAETLGVRFATVNRWENGWTKPSHLAARQIVQLCECNNVPSVGKTNDKPCDDNN